MLLLKTITDYEVSSLPDEGDSFLVNLPAETLFQILHSYNARRMVVAKKRIFFRNIRKHYSQREIKTMQGISQRELQYFSLLLKVFKKGLQKNKELLQEMSLSREDVARILYYCPMNHLYYYYNERALSSYEDDEVFTVIAIFTEPILQVSKEYEMFLNEKFGLGIDRKKLTPRDRYLLLLEEAKKKLDEEIVKQIDSNLI